MIKYKVVKYFLKNNKVENFIVLVLFLVEKLLWTYGRARMNFEPNSSNVEMVKSNKKLFRQGFTNLFFKLPLLKILKRKSPPKTFFFHLQLRISNVKFKVTNIYA